MALRQLKMIIPALVLLWMIPQYVSAHPHVFIRNSLTFVFDENGLKGIEQRWVFDEMFSAGIIFDYDTDASGSFDPAETAVIRKEVFSNLKKYGYFSLITIDARPFEVAYISEFAAGIDGGALVYTFFIPCHITAASSAKEIRISVFDESYYTDIKTLPGDVAIKNPTGFECELKHSKNRDISFYYDQFHPDCHTLRFRRKP